MDPIKLPEKSLEIRINSVQDAKSVVSNMRKILDIAKTLGVGSVQYFIAQEIVKEVDPIIAGACPLKTYWKTISTTSGNILFILPHFQERIIVPIQTQKSEPVAIKRRFGRPKGSKNKPKSTEQTATS